MESHKLVLPEHLNQFGLLFGGNMLKWVDEFAWIAASMDHPDCNFVTIAFDKVEFRKGVKEGTILKFVSTETNLGKTSVQYKVDVFRGKDQGELAEAVFTTQVTLVNIDDSGNKVQLPKT
jgi:acyl-CoA hydrolase